MLRILLGLLFLTACSVGTVKTGGERVYSYDVKEEYTSEKLRELSPEIIVTERRDPPVGKLDELFSSKGKDLRRMGIVVFESVLQPTRGGLAEDNLIYLSSAGKQLMTEKFLKIWEEAFPLLSTGTDLVRTRTVKNTSPMVQYGEAVEDFIHSGRSSLMPDDIFYLAKGKSTTTATILNPRNLRDLSFLLVPASELMSGPKWSEHQKHFLNEIAKELKLDAVLVILSEASWTAAHMDKHSGEVVPEQMTVKLTSSVLTPFSEYHARLRSIGIKDEPNVTICYRKYDGQVRIPVTITQPEMDQNFPTIERELVNPLFKAYRDLVMMTIDQMDHDFRKTY